ncbi:hypothetical protein F5B20DRAFT_303842 [Whalleya microplaca]|nr:hypothetical protein F5B20DRAFT_303842 [Whalleya microplaca]
MPRQFNRTACNTCRHRKLKCDEGLPICQRCAKAGRYCDRSERPLQLRRSSVKRSSNRALVIDTPRKALEKPETANYFHHYIVDLALWYDLNDALSTFATKVPVIALDEPLLFSAIIALSAMHVSKTTAPSARDAAESYHTNCIRLLIELDAEDARVTRGVALAATCLLRSYEILDEEVDPNRHLQGAYSFASQRHSLPDQLSERLFAAGFWNYLREDITFSLFDHCRLKMDLGPIPDLTVFLTDNDHLNAITLILGRIINVTIGESTNTTEAKWNMLLVLVRVWLSNLPPHFEPFSRAPVPLLSKLPSVRILQDCHAAARHYLLVSLFMLAMRAPSSAQLGQLSGLLLSMGIDSVDHTKEDILEQLSLEICGIAFTSNKPAILVNAFGPISFCARYIRDDPARQEVVGHLFACQKSTGWPVQQIITRLKNYWG